MTEKLYVPKCNARARQTSFGEVLTIGFDVKELIAFAEANKNERGFLNVCVVPRKTPNEYATHSVYLDTYKPRDPGAQGGRRREQPAPTPTEAPAQPEPQDDVPF